MKKSTLNILVTGGVGFVGTHLCRTLIGAGHRVTSLDLRNPKTPVEGVRYVQGDVRDASKLMPLVAECDVVYHLAATVSVPVCQKDPIESTSNNFESTLRVLEAIRHKRESQSGQTGLVFASTAAVYGSLGDSGQPLIEEQVAEHFSNFYAAQKHASEQMIRLYHATHGIPSTVFRFFNIYGEGQDPSSPYSGVITIFKSKALAGAPMVLHGGGNQTRDFIAVEDIVSGCVKALGVPLDRWNGEPINLGTGETLSVRELAEWVKTTLQSQSTIEAGPARDGDVQHSRASVSRAADRLGFRPALRVRDGLARLLKGEL